MYYKVKVIRIGYREKEIEVEAHDLHEAKKKAEQLAPSQEFPSEHDYEYATEVQAIMSARVA